MSQSLTLSEPVSLSFRPVWVLNERDCYCTENVENPPSWGTCLWDERENVKRGRRHRQSSATRFCRAGRLGYAGPSRSLLSSKRYVTHILWRRDSSKVPSGTQRRPTG